MTKKVCLSLTALVNLLAHVFLLSACGSKNIEGTVKDPYGQGIEGVTIQVEKSTFTATSNSKGTYSVDYVPGAFTIKFSKAGYTTQELQLTIQEKRRFPAETIVMCAIPRESGIYYLSEKDIVKLEPVKIGMVKKPGSGFEPTHYEYFSKSNGSLIIPPKEVTFIDRTADESQFKLVRLTENGLIQHFAWEWGVARFIYDGSMSDVKDYKVGQEHLLLRKIDLKPGPYAWVEMIELMTGGSKPADNSSCYPFRVVPVESEQPGAVKNISQAAEFTVQPGATVNNFTYMKTGTLTYRGESFSPSIKIDSRNVSEFMVSLMESKGVATIIAVDIDGHRTLTLFPSV